MKLGRCLAVFVAVFMLVAAIPFSVVAVPPPVEVFVDATYDTDTPGWGEIRFDSIQDGIDAVASEGTVYVNAGTYNENLTISKSLSLMAAPGVILDGTGLGGNGILIRGDDITISGLEITNFANGIRTYGGPSVYVNLRILDCLIHNNSAVGILILMDTFDLVEIIGTDVHENASNGLGISDGAVIGTLHIEESKFENNGHHGVYITSTGTGIYEIDIVRSLFRDNNWEGLHIAGDLQIGDFTAFDSDFDFNLNGIVIQGPDISSFTLEQCSVYSNNNHGIWIRDGNTNIDELHITNCGVDVNTHQGIFIQNPYIGLFVMEEGSLSGNAWGFLARNNTEIDILAFAGVTVANNHTGSGVSVAAGEYGVVFIWETEFTNNAWEHVDIGIDWLDGIVTLDNLVIAYSSFDMVPWISVYMHDSTIVNVAAMAEMCWWGDLYYPYGKFSDGIEVSSWALDEDFGAFATYYEIDDATDYFEIWDFNLAMVDLEEMSAPDTLVFESGRGDYTLVLPVGIIPDGVTTFAIVQRDVDYWVDDLPEWVKGDDAAAAPTGFMFQSKIFRFVMVDFSGGLEPTEDELVTEFDGNFTLIFYFDPDDIDDLDRLDVYWFDGTEWVALGGVVDEVAGTVTVEVDHWSDFALMEEEAPVLEPEPETPETGTSVMLLIPFGLLLMLAGAFVIRKRVLA